jgi:hypothetical protein
MLYLTTLQTVALAVELSLIAAIPCVAIVVQIRRASDWRSGRHSAPPTPPAPPQSPPPSEALPTDRRTLARDWREQVELPADPVLAVDPPLIRPYVLAQVGVAR